MGCFKTIVGTALLPGIGTMIGAGMDAQDDASAEARRQQEQGQAFQERIYQQQRADFAPYRDVGAKGVKDYQSFLEKPQSYLDTPSYQWMKGQIDKDMNRQLSARGRANSTYGMNSLGTAYGNLAAEEYNNAYNRMLDPIKIGQGAANSTGAASQNYANAYANIKNNMANLAVQEGQNRASLYGDIAALPFQALGAYTGFKG